MAIRGKEEKAQFGEDDGIDHCEMDESIDSESVMSEFKEIDIDESLLLGKNKGESQKIQGLMD